MPFKRFRIRRVWLPSVFGRVTALLMAVSLVTLYFYLLGSSQGFTDRTLVVLLDIEFRILSATAITGILSAIAYTVTGRLQNRWPVTHIILSMLAGIFSFVLYVGISLLQSFKGGYPGA